MPNNTMDVWFNNMQAKFYADAQEIISQRTLELREKADEAVKVMHETINEAQQVCLESITSDLAEMFGLNPKD